LSHNAHFYSNIHEVVGEVKNTGSQNMKYIKISADFYDAQNNKIGSGFMWQDIQILRPGEISSFRVSSSSVFNHYVLTSSLGTMPYTTDEPYDDFEITQQSGGIEGDEYRVTGEIKNTGAENRSYLSLYVSFYDSSGKVVARGYMYTSGGLDAGETIPFDVSTYTEGLASPIASYTVRFTSWY
jgi:hypothetical protein